MHWWENSNRLTLGPRKPYMHVHMPHFCPGTNFVILTLRTLRLSLYWRLIWVSTLQPKDGGVQRPPEKKIQKGMGRFRPHHFFSILTLHTLRQWLDWPLIWVSTLQPEHEAYSSQSKKISWNFTSHQFTRKPLIAEILERWLLVGKKVPYKFPNDIASKLLTLHGVNQLIRLSTQKRQTFRTTIAQRSDP